VNAEKLATRKARDRELYNAAGLMILAGLVDSRTGMPLLDRGELLGALMELSRVSPEDERKAQWKRNGDALLAEKMKAELPNWGNHQQAISQLIRQILS
jgi:hypothetical protein